MFGRIAQLVEQKTLNLLVGGSSPPAPTFQVTRSLVDFLLGLEGRSMCEFVRSARRTRESRPAGIFRQGNYRNGKPSCAHPIQPLLFSLFYAIILSDYCVFHFVIMKCIIIVVLSINLSPRNYV